LTLLSVRRGQNMSRTAILRVAVERVVGLSRQRVAAIIAD